MKRLNSSWFTEGDLDFEIKKYTFLGYLKHTYNAFNRAELFPHLGDLNKQKKMMKAFLKERDKWNIALDQLNINTAYSSSYNLDKIIDFAYPKINSTLETGQIKADEVKSAIKITTIGLEGMYKKEGYWFLSSLRAKRYSIYRFSITSVLQDPFPYTVMHLTFIEKARQSIFNTLEKKKMELAKRFKDLPIPMVYLIEYNKNLPFSSALIPMAKKLILEK